MSAITTLMILRILKPTRQRHPTLMDYLWRPPLRYALLQLLGCSPVVVGAERAAARCTRSPARARIGNACLLVRTCDGRAVSTKVDRPRAASSFIAEHFGATCASHRMSPRIRMRRLRRALRRFRVRHAYRALLERVACPPRTKPSSARRAGNGLGLSRLAWSIDIWRASERSLS
jgi:hypothetical protein